MKENILIIEDDPIFLETLNKDIQNNGYKTYLATTGEEGLRIFTENRQNIFTAIIDFGLPDTTGRSVIEKINMLDPNFDSIVLSNYTQGDIVDKLLGLTKIPIICYKEYDIDQLTGIIENIKKNYNK